MNPSTPLNVKGKSEMHAVSVQACNECNRMYERKKKHCIQESTKTETCTYVMTFCIKLHFDIRENGLVMHWYIYLRCGTCLDSKYFILIPQLD